MKKLISVILALVLILSCLPLSTAAKTLTVEDRFRLMLEDMELDSKIYRADRYFYEELAQYPEDNPEWVLVRAGLQDQRIEYGEVAHHGTLGNKHIVSSSISSPFSFDFGVYSVSNNTFYDLIDAWNMDFSTLRSVWNALPGDLHQDGLAAYKFLIGDADNDGEVTILDATRIQRIIAELEVQDWDLTHVWNWWDLGVRLGAECDYDRDSDLTILDATKIQRRIADLPNVLDTELAFDMRTYHSENVGGDTAQLITSVGELEDFYQTYGETVNDGGDFVSHDAIEGYDDKYFAENMLIGCYVYLTSGSYHLIYGGAKIENDSTLVIDFSYNTGLSSTSDINERFILIEASRAFADDINDVRLNVAAVKQAPDTLVEKIVPDSQRTATAPADLNSGGYKAVEVQALEISSPNVFVDVMHSPIDLDEGCVVLIRSLNDFRFYLPDFDKEQTLDSDFFGEYAVLAVFGHGGDHNAYAMLDNIAVGDDTLYSNPWIGVKYLYYDDSGDPIGLPTDPLVWKIFKVKRADVKNVKALAFWKAPAYDPDTLFVTQITDDKKVAEGTYGDALPYNSLSTSTRVFTWDYQKYGDGSDFLNQPYRVAIIRSYDQYEAFFGSDHFEGIDDYAYKPINYYPLDDAFFRNNALIVGVGYFCTGDEYLFFDEIRQSDDGEVLTVRFNRYTYGDLHPYEPYAANILGYCFAAASVPKDSVKYVNAVQMLPQVKKLPDDVYSRMEYGILYNETGDFYTNFSEENEAYYVTSPQELTTAIDALMVDEGGEHIMRGSYRFPVEDTAAYGDAWFAEYDMIAARVYKGGSNTRLYVTDLERSAAGNLRLECTKLHDEYDTPDNTWNFIFLSVEKQEKKPKITIEVIDEGYEPMPEKPIIYLYPEQETELTVTLGKPEELTCTYPAYNDGWHVTAHPDGTLTDDSGRSYYSLYWESRSHMPVSVNDGFVVRGEDTAKFFEEKLAIMGLSEREAEEFIVYWLPQMQHNEYNLIRFATPEEIEQIMPLSFSVQPDTVIRVLMEYVPLDEPLDIPEQTLTTPERKGFTAVEWGGIRLG